MSFEIIRGRGQHVRHAGDQIAAAIAVAIDGVFVVGRRQELGLADFAGPFADHLRGRHVAAIDDAQGRHQFGLEFLRASR